MFTDFGDEIDPSQQIELLEEKLSEAVEGMSEKSVQSRINGIETVSSALRRQFLPEFFCKR